VAETAEVLRLIHRLREQGLGVIVISHNLDTVFDVADRIVVLRLGRRVATFERSQTTREEVVATILGVAVPVTV
jgi:D-xylose transport system ATP-binding protein